MNSPFLVNNTACNLNDFYPAIIASIKANGTLPEELADLFALTSVTVDGNVRYIINAA